VGQGGQVRRPQSGLIVNPVDIPSHHAAREAIMLSIRFNTRP